MVIIAGQKVTIKYTVITYKVDSSFYPYENNAKFKGFFMLVTFKCNAYENITMLGDVAIRLLHLMGHSGTVPGAILAEDVPGALSLLKGAIKQTDNIEEKNVTSQNDDDEPEVSLALHAFPLIELLTNAAQQKCNVMWDKG